MTATPWMKFYPRDWRGDQSLRAVSVAARGLWMECICIMHEAKPYGHLLLNGAKVEGDTLARMAGVSVDEVSALMTELRQAGVFSVTSKGVVFSRRMVADFARAQKGRKAVARRYTQDVEKQEETNAPNRSPSRVPITQKPEARSQKENNPPAAEKDRFAEWYAAYPRHVGRGQAERAYRQALRKLSHAELLEAAKKFSIACVGRDPQFVPHPATWLNGERWADDSGPPQGATQTDKAAYFRAIRERYTAGGAA